MKRTFRTDASYIAEGITRAMVPAFLSERGFSQVADHRANHGMNQSQIVEAVSPNGTDLRMRVRLCWRRESGDSHRISAAQLLSGIKNGDWKGSIQQKLEREQVEGVSHFLFVQRDGDEIELAALIPLSAMLPIWCRQREVSSELIAQGKAGRRKTNHSANGASPTYWFRDDNCPAVARVLWQWEGVQDLSEVEEVSRSESTEHSPSAPADSFDDLPVNWVDLGRDETPPRRVLRSSVPRDLKVRRVVLARASKVCEREGCFESRDFRGFLDVHHILGAGTSDRVWNCVALCPNCHREAHFSPDMEAINVSLLAVAKQRSSYSVLQ